MVGSAGHSIPNNTELGIFLIYFIGLPISLFKRKSNKHVGILFLVLSIMLLIIGLACIFYQLYDLITNRFDTYPFVVSSIALTLFIITLIGSIYELKTMPNKTYK
ncbi:MAG: hypothetical protein COA88_15600 [Kordia sp.]|nr:MAG: hypothetical protein COA88_15600 [Kordia sp.]